MSDALPWRSREIFPAGFSIQMIKSASQVPKVTLIVSAAQIPPPPVRSSRKARRWALTRHPDYLGKRRLE